MLIYVDLFSDRMRATTNIQSHGFGVVAIDRMEKGSGDRAALVELAEEFDMPTCAIATIDEVVEALRGRELDGREILGPDDLERIRLYRETYGA